MEETKEKDKKENNMVQENKPKRKKGKTNRNVVDGYLCLSKEHTMYKDPNLDNFYLFRRVENGEIVGWYKAVRNLDLNDPKHAFIKRALEEGVLYYSGRKPAPVLVGKEQKRKKIEYTEREKELIKALSIVDIKDLLAFVNGQPLVLDKNVVINPPKGIKEYQFLLRHESMGENKLGHPRWRVVENILKILDKKYGVRQTGMTPIIQEVDEFVKLVTKKKKRGRKKRKNL